MVAYDGGLRAAEQRPHSLGTNASQGALSEVDAGRCRVRAAAAAFGAQDPQSGSGNGPAGDAVVAPALTRVPSMSRVKAAAAALEAAYGGKTAGGQAAVAPGSVAAALARFREVNNQAPELPPTLRHSVSVPNAAGLRSLRDSAASSPRDLPPAQPLREASTPGNVSAPVPSASANSGAHAESSGTPSAGGAAGSADEALSAPARTSEDAAQLATTVDGDRITRRESSKHPRA